MPNPNTAALDFLLNRRSRPAKTLRDPVPDREELIPILTAAARTPDHGKLEPWRFIVLERAALDRLANLALSRAADIGVAPDKIAKGVAQYRDAPLAIAVISCPRASDKVPHIEQLYSAGAACLALLNGALASGWGANWLSGWASHDRQFVTDGLGLTASETVVGIVVIGTQTSAPPERPRPDITSITDWVSK